MDEYPKPVSKECTKKIINQIDNSICKIEEIEGKSSFGFFCLLKCEDKNIKVLISDSKVVNEKYLARNNNINVSINKKTINIEFGKTKYLDKDNGLSIIEIKENKNNKIENFMEFDEH